MAEYIGSRINNGIEFTTEEKESLKNIINYLKKLDFNDKTIEVDAENAKKCYQKNPGHPLFIEFIDLFNKYLNEIQQAIIHYQHLTNNSYHPLVKELLEYSSIPLRYSDTPEIDGLIMLYYCNIKSLFEMIKALSICIPNYNCEYDYSLLRGEINFNSLGKGPKVGWIHRIPEKFEDIEKNFNYTFELYKRFGVLNSNYVGDYAELCTINEYLHQIKKDNEDIIWVSKDFGDGFGYDIMLYDNSTGKVRVYEVKGSIKKDYSLIATLSDYEKLKKNYCIEENTEYHIIKVYIDENKNRYYYDINTNNKTVTDINGNSYCLEESEDNKTYIIGEKHKVKTLVGNY